MLPQPFFLIFFIVRSGFHTPACEIKRRIDSNDALNRLERRDRVGRLREASMNGFGTSSGLFRSQLTFLPIGVLKYDVTVRSLCIWAGLDGHEEELDYISQSHTP
ncbi:hypothetical protein B0H14DRAFT_1025916 [Mycena olivaceomarginata]|jgi:hypothetical protein|nr:hypothetical protein B0H14DRAFT_1025916 [Mycena olivaceomarginata]